MYVKKLHLQINLFLIGVLKLTDYKTSGNTVFILYGLLVRIYAAVLQYQLYQFMEILVLNLTQF